MGSAKGGQINKERVNYNNYYSRMKRIADLPKFKPIFRRWKSFSLMLAIKLIKGNCWAFLRKGATRLGSMFRSWDWVDNTTREKTSNRNILTGGWSRTDKHQMVLLGFIYLCWKLLS